MERWEAKYVTQNSQATSVLLREATGGGSAQSTEGAASFHCDTGDSELLENEEIVSIPIICCVDISI